MSRQSRSLLRWRRVSRKVSIDTPSSVIREPPPVYLTGIPKVHREITRGRARCRWGFELAQAIPAHLAWKRRFALRRISKCHAQERVEQELSRGSKGSNSRSNTYACEFRSVPWTVTMCFKGAVPFSPTARILGMPTRDCGASLKHSSSYFDKVRVVSSFSSLDIEPNMRLKEWTSV